MVGACARGDVGGQQAGDARPRREPQHGGSDADHRADELQARHDGGGRRGGGRAARLDVVRAGPHLAGAGESAEKAAEEGEGKGAEEGKGKGVRARGRRVRKRAKVRKRAWVWAGAQESEGAEESVGKGGSGRVGVHAVSRS